MLRYLKFLILAPVAVAIVTLAVINRGPATLAYLPPQLGSATITLPMFVVLFLALMLGVVIGGGAAWFAQGRHRRAERQYRREAERLKSEADRLRAMQPASGDLSLPALKSR
jgi:uncharacterized integral membrane protein